MSLSQSEQEGAVASSAPLVWRARYSQVVHVAAELVQRRRSRACGSASASDVGEQRLEQARLPAGRRTCRALASVWWPMPRLGVVTARRNAGSSSLLTIRRSQAHRSLISARSKKLCPPETLYGICALRSACSKTRAWWLARYRIAKSLPVLAPAVRADATGCAPPRARPRAPRRRTRRRAPARRRRARSTASSRRASGCGRSRCWRRAGCAPVER